LEFKTNLSFGFPIPDLPIPTAFRLVVTLLVKSSY
jgi:hypothetical protein